MMSGDLTCKPFAAMVSAEVAAHWSLGNWEAANVLLARAAAGRIEDQRLLAQGFADVAYGTDEQPDAFLVASEVFARMAASHGDAGDRRRLAGVLSLHAAHHRRLGLNDSATDLEAECLVILNMLADEGFEEAADAVSTLAPCFSAEAVASARTEAAKRQVATVNIAPPPLADPAPAPALLEASPLNRWERCKLWCEDRGWAVRFYFDGLWFALCSLGRALVGRY